MNIYSKPLFRPPSEGDSIIVQITKGCPYNQCVFCAMYKMKKYSEITAEDLRNHLQNLVEIYDLSLPRVFLADGDSLYMTTDKLINYMQSVKEVFQNVKRFSTYGSIYSLKEKSVDDLIKLKKTGLRVIYLGLESGSHKVLTDMKKDFSDEIIIENCQKVLKAGLKLSVMIIIGLGGLKDSDDHIIASANLINKIKPNYTSLLNIMLGHTKLKNDSNYTQFGMEDYFKEITRFIKKVNVTTVFRSNHASNYLSLEGVLPRDKEKLLLNIKQFN